MVSKDELYIQGGGWGRGVTSNNYDGGVPPGF